MQGTIVIEFIDGFATSSGALQVYLFHPHTGEYMGPCTVYVSEGCGLAPGHALDEPSMAAPGHAVQRIDDVWVEVEDHRGTAYRTQDGEQVQHDRLGTLPDELTLEPRPSRDYLWKNGTWVFDAQLQADNRLALAEELFRKIDGAADSARQLLVGDPLRVAEYEKVASEALSFKNSGYPEQEVPRTVAADVTPERTPRQVADSILAAHDQYNEMLYQIREARLASKAQVRTLIAAQKDVEARQVVNDAVATLQAVSV